MRARHRNSGGSCKLQGEQGSARKRGGSVHPKHLHGEGGEAHHRADRKERKRGGGVHHDGHPKHHADGGKAHHAHMHSAHAAKVPGRKRGGGIGANLTPLSTAARIKEVTKGESSEDMGKH